MGAAWKITTGFLVSQGNGYGLFPHYLSAAFTFIVFRQFGKREVLFLTASGSPCEF
jgi:hypothetical protein